MNIASLGRRATQVVQIVAHRLVARILVGLIIAILPLVLVESTALFVAVVECSPERFLYQFDAARIFVGVSTLILSLRLSLLPALRFRPFIPLILIVRAIVRLCSIGLILILLWLTYIIIINFHH